jgi:uroporphyrinogen-III synthase
VPEPEPPPLSSRSELDNASDPASPAERPLEGRRIAVTRAEQQLGAARRLFEQAGAQVFDLPALVIGPPDHWGPLDDALAELEDFHWLIVSSANGVEAVEAQIGRAHV